MEKEIRSLGPQSELRAAGNSRTVEGYGIVFRSLSKDLGGFREIILPEAVEGVWERSDVLCLLNHSIERGVLARSKYGKGTLKLQPDSKGVKYSFVAPDTSLGAEVIEGIRRGDIRSSSFAFTIEKDGEKWERRDGENIRTIIKFAAIYDVSPCYRESYEETSAALRSLDKFKNTPIPKAEVKKTYSDAELAAMRKRTALLMQEIKQKKVDDLAAKGFYEDSFGRIIPIKKV